ncbi:MAG: hypothetical protein ISP90_18945, partial [Nevskia sp.]|nr:hypothetical protein [Nevskia sp.]
MNLPTARSADHPARRPSRKPRRAARGAAVRRRPPPRPAAWVTAGQVDTWLLQGLIVAAMGGMLAWFHAPLGALVKG